MKRYSFLFAFILFVSLLLNNGCKKQENLRRATYQLDSIEIIQVTNSGDTSSRFGFALATNSIDSFEYNFPFYRFKDDSIVCSYYENPYDPSNNYYQHLVLNNKLVLVTSNYDHSHYAASFATLFKYNSNDNIDSIITKIGVFESGPEANFTINRKVNYTGGNLTSITETLHSFFRNTTPSGDSTNYRNIVPSIFSYTNNYSNQKDLIGLDVNEIIFDIYRLFYLNGYYSPYGGSHTGYFPFEVMQILIANNKIGFKTNCSSLIEQINFDPASFLSAREGIVHLSALTSEPFAFHISYSFDSANNNRISQMVIEAPHSLVEFGKVIYRFKYAEQ
ncbi:MAG: hypothetical protein U0T69_10170 [Chitinophagales bacterium]